MENRVYRSQNNRVIAGVAGGLAEYFNVDVVLVRLLWVVAGFAGGGILAYIIAWIVIPEENNSMEKKGPPEIIIEAQGNREEHNAQKQEASIRRQRNFGLVLIALGIIFLTRHFLGFLFLYFWPLLLIALGVYLLLRERKEA